MGELFSLRGQLNHRFLGYGLDGNAAGHGGTTFVQLEHTLPSLPDFPAGFSLRGFKPAHRPALLLQVNERLPATFGLQPIEVGMGLAELGVQDGPGRVGNFTGGIVGPRGVFD